MVRPLDLLEEARGKRVLVELRNGEKISGLLRAFDQHLNLHIAQAEKLGEEKTKLGELVLRGSNILYVSPAR